MNTTTKIHSTQTLIKASLFAAILAAVLLVFAILPAEYNIDPTGLGKYLGFTQLSAAEQADTPKIENSNETKQAITDKQDKVTIEIFPGQGLEYKFFLTQYQKLEYTWSTDSGQLHFDFHGEPQGDTTGFFESYTIATSSKMKGTLTTPFAGSHGWYWRNDTGQTININLETRGNYEIIGLK